MHNKSVFSKHSGLVRWLLMALGTFFVVLAAIGLVLPLIPTTPFLLLAAACYARASQRCYSWLINNPAFGPIISDWRSSRSIPKQAKQTAILIILVIFPCSIFLFKSQPIACGLLAVIGLGLIILLSRIPNSSQTC